MKTTMKITLIKILNILKKLNKLFNLIFNILTNNTICNSPLMNKERNRNNKVKSINRTIFLNKGVRGFHSSACVASDKGKGKEDPNKLDNKNNPDQEASQDNVEDFEDNDETPKLSTPRFYTYVPKQEFSNSNSESTPTMEDIIEGEEFNLNPEELSNMLERIRNDLKSYPADPREGNTITPSSSVGEPGTNRGDNFMDMDDDDDLPLSTSSIEDSVEVEDNSPSVQPNQENPEPNSEATTNDNSDTKKNLFSLLILGSLN